MVLLQKTHIGALVQTILYSVVRNTKTIRNHGPALNCFFVSESTHVCRQSFVCVWVELLWLLECEALFNCPSNEIPNGANECKQHSVLGASTSLIYISLRHWQRQTHITLLTNGQRRHNRGGKASDYLGPRARRGPLRMGDYISNDNFVRTPSIQLKGVLTK